MSRKCEAASVCSFVDIIQKGTYPCTRTHKWPTFGCSEVSGIVLKILSSRKTKICKVKTGRREPGSEGSIRGGGDKR